MAYRGHDRSQSVSSFSGISCLDGVRLKISERCLPPPKIALPGDYHSGNPTEVLFMDYDFHLEEKVIAWAEIQKQTRATISKVETQRIGESIEQFTRDNNNDDQAVEDPGGVSDEGPQDAANISSSSSSGLMPTSSSPAAATAAAPAPVAPSATVPVNPSWLNLGSDILMPTPISVTASACKTPDGKPASFDLADFEGVQDPFENAELRILNDREELNKMWTAVQPSLPASTEQAADGGLEAPQAAPASGSVQPVTSDDPTHANITTNTPMPPPAQPAVTTEGVNMDFLAGKVSFRSVNATTNGQISVNGPPIRSLKDVEYPDIFSSSYSSSSTNASGTVPSYQAPTSVYYPPQTSQMSVSHPSVPMSNSPASNSAYVPPSTSSHHYLVNSHALSHSAHLTNDLTSVYSSTKPPNGYSQCAGYMPPNGVVTPASAGQPATSMNPLRSTRSTPDISQCERNVPPVSHTPPPYVTENRRSRPSTPTQMRNGNSASPAHGSSMSPSQYQADVTTHSQRSQLPDPYSSMSSETQRFVDNISDMGFRRSCVARAVEKLGQDPKQILDHLVLVNRLTEDGHSVDDAETALFTLSHDEKQVLQFLKLLSQFRELGFAENKIKEALILSELDENKTLDQLTAG